ncbi:YetF domain-containing protein [Oceanobacillus kapialis]|uniref:YetF domain-containing protein n=1 Tax=Oceanobacillus kapialis TaxID=481353 RepID=A0ABW5Q2D3_9BACI
MNDYLSMFLETLFGFTALFFLTKILGKTQINQLTPFDFISALILGELVGNALFDKEAGIGKIAFAIVLWGVLLYLTEISTQKWKRTRVFMEGSPDIVIYKGKLIRDTMKKSKLDINQLQHLLREKDVFSIQEVEYAILETNGKVSVLKKAASQTPTKQDLKVASQEVHLATTLINDGEILYDNLQEKNLTEEWLLEQLHDQGYIRPAEVFYAEYIRDKQLFLLPFTNRNHSKFE